ncbi:unnamed protein product [Linum trigynum]|uniref:Nucleic acid binding protein n=1 Tax=Linum trigynum TaxID=586398 RepID=A0AAV2CDR1_9ROSI
MQALWTSLLNCKPSCRGKIADVCGHHDRRHYEHAEDSRTRSCSCSPPPSYRRSHKIRTQFVEVSIGDPARNVAEMIFHRASSSLNPTNSATRKIRKVLRVNNSAEIVERFERYREKVKKIACREELRGYPRSSVDGDEVLRFFGTTISCCNQQQYSSAAATEARELCRNKNCGVCRAIRCSFNTEHHRKNSGIQLSTRSDELTDEHCVTGLSKVVVGADQERAVVLCRAIAGATTTDASKVNNGRNIHKTDPNSNSESLVVTNPGAILPCFVIVFT